MSYQGDGVTRDIVIRVPTPSFKTANQHLEREADIVLSTLEFSSISEEYRCVVWDLIENELDSLDERGIWITGTIEMEMMQPELWVTAIADAMTVSKDNRSLTELAEASGLHEYSVAIEIASVYLTDEGKGVAEVVEQS